MDTLTRVVWDSVIGFTVGMLIGVILSMLSHR